MKELDEWIDILQLGHPGYGDLGGVFYYDESNIFHKLRLTSSGTNNDLEKYNFFVLGGLYLSENQNLDIETLIKALRLQPTVDEIYFSLLSTGGSDFRNVVGSQKIQILFQWLVDNQVMIHYSIVDYLYYSIIDIVDSIPSLRDHSLNENRAIKSTFHEIASHNITELMKFFYEFEYPNVEQSRVKEFIEKLRTFLRRNYNPSIHNRSIFRLLHDALGDVSASTKLVFIQTQESFLLFNHYESLYIDLPSRMKRGQHIVDRVDEIDIALRLVDSGYSNILNMKMADSKDDVYLQLSDVLVGFIRSLTMFIFKSSRADIIAFVRSLNPEQRSLIKNFYLLHNKSVKVSPFLYHFIAPDNILEKNKLLVSVATFG
jgi:hypothetical protein